MIFQKIIFIHIKDYFDEIIKHKNIFLLKFLSTHKSDLYLLVKPKFMKKIQIPTHFKHTIDFSD